MQINFGACSGRTASASTSPAGWGQPLQNGRRKL